ncbi:MAG: hypothetical protein M3361_13470, partial [Candidatus Tectomicrobia bacterium]|nr:hypothetical protein [Candidatus Tectomicrobia bacterium]
MWKPPIDWRSRVTLTLRRVLLFTPLSLVGLGVEAVYPSGAALRGLFESVYYGVVGLFALQLVLDFWRAASKMAFFRTHAFNALLLLLLPLASDGVRISVGLIALRQTLELIRFLSPSPGPRQRLSALR